MTHDFTTPIEKTATELAKQIISILSENKDILIFNDQEVAEISKETNEKSTDVMVQILQLITTSDIPADYAGRCFDKLHTTVEILKKYVEGHVRQAEDELLSRTLGARSPENNKYRSEVSTVGNLMLKLNEVRAAQGNNADDYFNTQQKISTDETLKQVEEPVATQSEQ